MKRDKWYFCKDGSKCLFYMGVDFEGTHWFIDRDGDSRGYRKGYFRKSKFVQIDEREVCDSMPFANDLEEDAARRRLQSWDLCKKYGGKHPYHFNGKWLKQSDEFRVGIRKKQPKIPSALSD